MPTLAGSYNVNSAGRDTTTLTTPSFTPTTGEILVLKGVTETSGFALGTPTASGGGITWTKRVENATGSNVYGVIWTGTVTSGGSAITVSIPGNASISGHSMTVERWSNAMLATTPVTVNVSGTGAPSTTITTTGTGSIVSYLDGDWAAVGGTAAYTNSATQDGIHQQATVYGAYYAYQTAATADSQTFGMSSPTGQTWTLLAIEIRAPSAQITHRGTTMNTTAGNKTVVATPAVGDLIVVIAAATGVNTTAIADTQSGTYVQVDSTRTGFSTTGNLNAWVRTTAISSAASTTWTATQTSSTGGGLTVYSVAGMSVFGASAVRSSGGQSTGTAATTPAPVLSLTPLSGNPIITGFGNATGTTTNVVQRTGYTEAFDNGYATPTTGYETAYRESGETSATLTYGGTSSSNFATIALELAYETAPDAPTLSSPTDTATVSTATPQLQWSDTDANGDNITYEAQVDTANTFDSENPAFVLGQNPTGTSSTTSVSATYASTPTQGNILIAAVGNNSGASSLSGWSLITTAAQTSAQTVDVFYKVAGASEPTTVTASRTGATAMYINLYELSGVSPNPIDVAASSGATATIIPTGSVTTTNAKDLLLAIVFSGSTGHASDSWDNSFSAVNLNSFRLGVASRSVSVTGTYTTNDTMGGSATATGVLVALRAGAVSDKFSASDSGFTDITNGAHTDPFPSGETIGYTTTSLSNGTYYWRVRGKDPTGTNTYGSWSSTHSFTVSVAGSTPTNQFFLFF